MYAEVAAYMISCPTAADRHAHMGVVSAPKGGCAFEIETGVDFKRIFRVQGFALNIGKLHVVADVKLKGYESCAFYR